MTAPADHMTIAEIIHDFATRQGDLMSKVHWVGEYVNTLHGNGAGSKDMERTSGDEDEVTCALCHTLLEKWHRDRIEGEA